MKVLIASGSLTFKLIFSVSLFSEYVEAPSSNRRAGPPMLRKQEVRFCFVISWLIVLSLTLLPIYDHTIYNALGWTYLAIFAPPKNSFSAIWILLVKTLISFKGIFTLLHPGLDIGGVGRLWRTVFVFHKEGFYVWIDFLRSLLSKGMFAVKVKRVDEQRVRHEKPVKHVVRVLRQVVSIKNSLQSLADNRFNRMTLKVLLHILRNCS